MNFIDYWIELLNFAKIEHKENSFIVSTGEKEKVLVFYFW